MGTTQRHATQGSWSPLPYTDARPRDSRHTSARSQRHGETRQAARAKQRYREEAATLRCFLAMGRCVRGSSTSEQPMRTRTIASESRSVACWDGIRSSDVLVPRTCPRSRTRAAKLRTDIHNVDTK
jgi:hypothetical protein